MAGIDNNMQWPSWDDLFGPDVPDPGVTPPFDRTPGEMPDYLRDRLGGNTGQDDQLGWNVGGQPERGPAPDPALAPAGMVANPYYYLPGNAAYIPESQYNELMQVAAGPQYDAYDAMYQTPGNDRYINPAKSDYDPGAPWQRENDYYDALKAKSDLSRLTAGNYEERGYVEVNGKLVPWGEYVSSGISANEFKAGPDIFNIAGIPQGFDNREGRPPAYEYDATTGEYVPAEVFIGGVPKDYSQGGSIGSVQWALSNDVSRSQPRSDPFGNRAFGGAPGGVVAPGSSAFDYLRGMSPDEITLTDGTVTTDPNPFRGKPGTTTRFEAEEGDTSDMYPGVSFYEVGPDGGFKKVTGKFEPGKEYFGVRESYDYTGFPMNPTIANAPAGSNFTVRIGDGGDINISDLDSSISLTSVTAINPATGQRKTFSPQEIQDGALGAPGLIPAGATLVVSKASGPEPKAGEGENYTVGHVDSLTPEQKEFISQTHPGYSNFVPVVKADGSITYMRRSDAVTQYGELAEDDVIRETVVPKYNDTVGTYIDPASGKYWFNDGTPAGKWLDKEDYDEAQKKQVYYDGKVWVDPVSGKYWVNDGTPEGKWVDRPAGEVVPPTPAATTTTTSTSTSASTGSKTAPADFTTQMISYIGGFYGKAGPNGLTYGKSGSIYPEYDDPTLESFTGDGWVIPISESTAGGSVVEIKKAAGGGKVWVFRPTDKDPNNWDEVKGGTIEADKRYIIVLSNTAIKNANTAASKVKK